MSPRPQGMVSIAMRDGIDPRPFLADDLIIRDGQIAFVLANKQVAAFERQALARITIVGNWEGRRDLGTYPIELVFLLGDD
jgi:hypothetical protein